MSTTFHTAAPLGQHAILLLVVALEVAVFAVIGNNFFTANNGLETIRVSVEVGLLAIALTPVILTGGIDLSVGSVMGLSAVVFGLLWRDAHLSIAAAAAATLGVGLAAGSVNALLVTTFRLPPLIVTLGTFSLFRGLAEGLTRGVDNFTNLPAGFIDLGQGDLWGLIPTQLPIFFAVAIAFWLLVHRTTVGRTWVAIGFSPEGARYAGLPVGRNVALAYVLSGVVSALAALIYVAHAAEAKADAGTSYELFAITAVVLGGTSIFGGRGTIHGTLLGLLVIGVLKRGFLLADLPGELAGMLTGGLLLVTISLDWLQSRPAAPAAAPTGDFEMKNSQVAVLCAVILAAAGIVAGSNWMLVKGLKNETKRLTVAMMPKSKGNAYFIACQKGAEEAARELNVDLIWEGPTNPDPAEQTKIVEAWITRGVDVIAVAVENRDGISSVLQKAREKGIKVLTWDADAKPEARDFFVNQATPEGIAEALVEAAHKAIGEEGDYAIISASLTAGNMIAWQKQIEIYNKAKYPKLKQVDLRACDDKQEKAFSEATTILNAHPNVKLIMGICSPAVPGAAEAVKQSGRTDVKVVGLSLPSLNKMYVKDGTTDTVILWDTANLGYLTVYAAQQLQSGKLKAGDKTISAGRLGQLDIAGDNILLGKPMAFTKDNIDKYDF